MSKTDRTDGVYLLHIVESLQDVLDFLEGKDKALPEYISIIKVLG